MSRSAILELETPNGQIQGHKKCSEFITQSVSELLEFSFNFEERSQKILLNEIDKLFTKKDNEKTTKSAYKSGNQISTTSL